MRMNLQTGEKEAKLMDGDDGSKYKINKDSKQKFITIDKNVISKQHLKEALKEFKDKFHNENADGENSEQIQSEVEASEYIIYSCVLSVICIPIISSVHNAIKAVITTIIIIIIKIIIIVIMIIVINY